MNRQLAYLNMYSLIWFLKVATVLVNGVCEYDWEMLQSHTTDRPTGRKRHRTLTAEHNKSKATSSLFLMIVKLERTGRTTAQKKNQTKHTHNWSNNKQSTDNKRITALEGQNGSI